MYHLAFGLAPEVISFAASLTQSEGVLTLCWMDWPDELLLDSNGRVLPIMKRRVFIASFDGIIGQYRSMYPSGRLKFNLTHTDEVEHFRDTITCWEMRQISAS